MTARNAESARAICACTQECSPRRCRRARRTQQRQHTHTHAHTNHNNGTTEVDNQEEEEAREAGVDEERAGEPAESNIGVHNSSQKTARNARKFENSTSGSPRRSGLEESEQAEMRASSYEPLGRQTPDPTTTQQPRRPRHIHKSTTTTTTYYSTTITTLP